MSWFDDLSSENLPWAGALPVCLLWSPVAARVIVNPSCLCALQCHSCHPVRRQTCNVNAHAQNHPP